MRITYLANIRMPTERAHGVQIVKTCEALQRAGAEVELVVPARRTHIRESVEEYYRIKTPFTVTRLPVWDIVSWGRIGFVLETLSCAFASLRYVDGKSGVVYGRDEWILALLLLAGFEHVVWESHTGAWNMAARYLSRHTRVIVISEGLKAFYEAQGVSAERIVVAHDGVDPEDFEHVATRESARTRLGLPEDKKIALYIGGVGGWKGTNVLFEASKRLTGGIIVAIIGKVTDELKSQYPNIMFLGERPYKEIADNQQAGDVLVLPTTATHTVGAHFTSPLKLFTYMASGVPIIASDVLSVRDVLPEQGAYWCTADDPESLAQAIRTALTDPRSEERARIARNAVARYTWDTRARAILAYLTS